MSLTKVRNQMIDGAAVNVLDYGAVGDGVADDSAALQAAFNTGKTVYLPEGTYFTNGTILTLPERSVVHGDGPLTVILGDGPDPVLVLEGTDLAHKAGSTLRDMTVKRQNGTYVTGRQLMEIIYTDDFTVDSVIFDQTASTYYGSLMGISATRMTVSNCRFLNGVSCNLTSFGAISTNLWSTDCVVRDCYKGPSDSQGFDFYYVKDLLVEGCTAHGTTSTYGCGFIIEYQALNVTFSNCTSYDNTRAGFYYEPNLAYGLVNVMFDNCVAYSNGECGLYAQNARGLIVTGGAYHGATTAFAGINGGISLADVSEHCTITGAYIFSNQVAGIQVMNGTSNSISSNILYNNNGPAIKITAAFGQNIIGNVFVGNLSIISGWVENTMGVFSDYVWASYTPIVYSNDGTTTVTISNDSVTYKRIGTTVHVNGYFEFAGNALNDVMYIQAPIALGWTGGGTGAEAKMGRGVANSSAAGVLPVNSLYYVDRLSVSGMGVGDTWVSFSATYEIG